MLAHGHPGLDRAEALIATDVHDVNEEELSVSYYAFGAGPVVSGKATLMFEAQDDAWVFSGYNYEEDLGPFKVSLEGFEYYIHNHHPEDDVLGEFEDASETIFVAESAERGIYGYTEGAEP